MFITNQTIQNKVVLILKEEGKVNLVFVIKVFVDLLLYFQTYKYLQIKYRYLDFKLQRNMYYGIIGANTSTSQTLSELGPIYPPRQQSRCVTAMMLEVPVFFYGLLHLFAATFGLILLQV